MMQDSQQPAGNVQAMTQAQLEIYARELQQHFQEERRLRQELESRNQELEQRLNELTALNQLFQQHLAQRTVVVESVQELAQGLQRIARDSRQLLDRINAQGLLNIGRQAPDTDPASEQEPKSALG